MRKLRYKLPIFRFFLAILLFQAVSGFAGGIDLDNPEFSRWYNLIDADISEVEKWLGDSYIEIEPSAVGSRAERVIWYENRMTLWFNNNRVVQLRFDSGSSGISSGIQMGSPVSEITRICGRPWIEANGDLYYNLPWRSGPVRLRFIFDDSGLFEVYLYIVL